VVLATLELCFGIGHTTLQIEHDASACTLGAERVV
jgi:hypothetical protein